MAKKPARGRPQGSGINDDKILAKITGLLVKDPELKPTTAIKAAGVTDPSSIRRLREKLKSAAPAKKTARKKSPASRKPARDRKRTITAKSVTGRKSPADKARSKKKTIARKKVTTRTVAANRTAPKSTGPGKTVRTRKAPGKSAASPSATAADFGFKNPFADMTNGLSLPTEFPDFDMENLVSSTVEKQIQLYESALKFSPLANLLRHQAMLTDMMLTMLRTQKELTRPTKPKR